MSTPLLIVFGAAICLITGTLAARKGYNFYLWVLAGGIIGLVILSFLPFVNRGDLSEIEQAKEPKPATLSVVCSPPSHWFKSCWCCWRC